MIDKKHSYFFSTSPKEQRFKGSLDMPHIKTTCLTNEQNDTKSNDTCILSTFCACCKILNLPFFLDFWCYISCAEIFFIYIYILICIIVYSGLHTCIDFWCLFSSSFLLFCGFFCLIHFFVVVLHPSLSLVVVVICDVISSSPTQINLSEVQGGRSIGQKENGDCSEARGRSCHPPGPGDDPLFGHDVLCPGHHNITLLCR